MIFLKPHSFFYAIISGAILLFSACSHKANEENFTVKGKIANAEGKMIYLSNIGVKNIIPLDSAKIDKNGEYSFSRPRPASYEFFFLAIEGEKPITFAIDSTETVVINSDAKNFYGTYTVEGNSASTEIKEMKELQEALEKQVNEMLKSTSPAIYKTRSDIYALIGDFKENIIKQYIVPAPSKAGAYYALSLTLNGEPLFQPKNNRNDSKCFAAVATGLKQRFPTAKRTQHLCKIAEEALAATRPQKTKTVEVEEGDISTVGLFNIKLPNADGDSISLSSFAGKAVLLDFTVYEDAKISGRNINLREIYRKYHDRGFEIYQVSYDSREHFWQQSASNLPWVCVRDGEGARSSYLRLYNVQSLPTFYLIDKNNEIVLRDSQISNLEEEIEKLLK
ncbi:MAG: redoxin domain-containing protein [Bacteroidaceae bacterium]|nr:redoxin domain-containing protein [Bacteroidaceae bacterium]